MMKHKTSQEYYRANMKHARRHGLRWNQDEIDLILEQEYSDSQLAVLIGRSIEAIHIKRCRMKEMQDVSVQ